MKKTKFFPPYNSDGSTKFPDRKKSGVYLIKKNNKIVYVGFSASDLYKTMYRHFQTWNDRQHERITFTQLKNITVRVVYCAPKKAAQLEQALILFYLPEKNNKFPETANHNAVVEYEDAPVAPF